MIQHLRSRLRTIVATAICALVAAPALISGTASIAAAAPPGASSGILTVGGEANDPIGPGGDFNLWRFYTDAYSSLRAELVSPANFGVAGTVSKGRYQIAPNGLTTVTAAGLANLDVFFGAIPRDGWSSTESDALRDFVQNGGGLVLNLNQAGFGDLPAWLDTTLGLDLSPTRAFYGPSDCYPGIPDAGPASTSSGSHPVISGPFGASGTLTTYHTVSALTATGSATARYGINVSGSVPQFGIDGPVGDTNAPFTIQTASINPANITSVQFAIDGTPFGAPDTTFPFTAPGANPAVGAHTLTATATTNLGPSPIVSSVNINVVAAVVVSAFRGCPGSGNEIVNNNINGTTVATIEPGALAAGSGPVVVTTDLDLFSNVFAAGMGTNRTFALNVFGWMMDKIVPAYVPPPPPPPETYFPLQSPIRVYDSRLGGGVVESGESRSIKVAGVTVNGLSVPADATSIVANVTAVDSAEAGYLTVFPAGQPPPTISTHNFGRGENFANTVVTGLTNGNIAVLNQFYNNGAGGTHVLVDVIGYSRSVAGGSHLRTMPPVRALDSRVGTGTAKAPFHAGEERDLAIVGVAGIPANVQAVVLNMTVANATHTGSFVTVWPSGEPTKPNISNINIIAGVTRPNLVVARVGSNGSVRIANDSGDTDILADVVGYFEPTGTGGSLLTKPSPTRVLDTRLTGTPFGQGETRQITIRGLPGVASNAQTAILKITAVDPTADGGYLTVWPTGPVATPPNVSNLNFNAGMNIPNLVISQIGDDGRINIYNPFGSTQVLIDVLGYAD